MFGFRTRLNTAKNLKVSRVLSPVINLHANVTDNFIDGREFIKLTEEEVNQMVAPLGLAQPAQSVSPLTWTMSPPLFSQSPQESGSTEFLESDDSSIISATYLHKELQIPHSWPPSIMQCIGQENDEERKRSLVPTICNEIVHVRATNVLPQSQSTQGVMHQDC